jgi:TetR/AcrR family transcriptional repressor of nem operon
MGKGELTRQRIVEEAAVLFNLQGFAGTSVQDVLEATGLEKGGLYRHFGSKEELAVEAFRYALARAVRLRVEHLETIEGSIEKLRAGIQRFVETPSGMPGGCPLMNTAIDADDGNPALRALVSEGFEAWRGRLMRIVADGIERGEIRAGVLPRSVANVIIGGLEGGLMMSRLEGNCDALLDAQAGLEGMLRGIAV